MKILLIALPGLYAFYTFVAGIELTIIYKLYPLEFAFFFFVVQCEPLVEILKAVGAPSHILLFIQEYYRGIQVCTILYLLLLVNK